MLFMTGYTSSGIQTKRLCFLVDVCFSPNAADISIGPLNFTYVIDFFKLKRRELHSGRDVPFQMVCFRYSVPDVVLKILCSSHAAPEKLQHVLKFKK